MDKMTRSLNKQEDDQDVPQPQKRRKVEEAPSPQSNCKRAISRTETHKEA